MGAVVAVVAVVGVALIPLFAQEVLVVLVGQQF